MKTARGVGLLSALLGTLTGCTTYVAGPAPRTVYVPPPPVSVEAPRVYVAPPPVYVPPAAGVGVSVEIRTENDFYEPLRPYGRWEMVEPHGRCWIPSRLESDWRPYCNGHWERTEAGWYWASAEPWAWATYHYGRWDFSLQFGWYWVPRTQWAPAWVSWHHGSGYLGWAPLSPSVSVAASGAVEVDVRLIPPRAFIFVEEKHFLEPVRPTTVIVNNTTIINETVNITQIKVVNHTVINEGPRTEVVEQVTRRKVHPVPVHELRRKEEAVVIAGKRAPPPEGAEKVQTPVGRQAESQETSVPMESERRARQLHEKAHEESQRTAKGLERKAQLESEQQARELQRKAQAESQRQAKELERNARLESERRARELQQKALEESQRTAKELERKAQLQAEQQARELQKKAQEESQRKARELETKAQLQAEQRAWELHQKAHEKLQKTATDVERKSQLEAQHRGRQRPSPAKQPGTNTVDRTR